MRKPNEGTIILKGTTPIETDLPPGGINIVSSDSGWQPIETAPKEVDTILLYTGDCDKQIYGGYWFEEMWTTGEYDIEGATHWMKLPAPPKDFIAPSNGKGSHDPSTEAATVRESNPGGCQLDGTAPPKGDE